MRIGFDAKKIVSNLTGIGNYSRGLVNILSADGNDECVLYTPKYGDDRCRRELLENSNVRYVYPSATSSIGRHWWRNHGMINDIRKDCLDLFHGLSNELPFGISSADIPTAVTIHDLIFLRYPNTYDLLSRLILERKTRYACKTATRIIAISEQTKRDIIDFYHTDPDKIDVVYQGCNPAFYHKESPEKIRSVRDEYNLPERYMLSVGTIEDRKNHSTIVKAIARLNEPEIPLVIVSKHTSLQKKLECEIQSLGITDRVRIINNVTFDRLPALYQGSQAAIYFSYFEGFGIPVLEGLASGVPVIAATGSCLEEAGGAGAIYCNPFAPDELADAMRQVLSDGNLRQQLSEGGKEHLKNFSTETLRDNLRKFYNRLI